MSPCGGVKGTAFVSIGRICAVLGRSGEELSKLVCEVCFSKILETTLPRLLFPAESLSCGSVPARPPALRSGLMPGLAPRLGLKASFNLPTGEGERLCDPSVGA